MVTTLHQQSAPFFRLPDFARDSKLCVAYRAKEEISRTRIGIDIIAKRLIITDFVLQMGMTENKN